MYQDPANMRLGGGAGGTTLDPVVAVALLIAMVLVLMLPKRQIIVPFLVVSMMAPFGQQLYVGGFHFYIARTLGLVGWLRIAFSKMTSGGEIVSGGFNPMDKIFIAWALFKAVATVLMFQEFAAVTNQVAFLWDALGGYFLFRFLIRDTEDVIRTVKVFASIVIVFSVTMYYETLRNSNVFGYIGGRLIPFLRDGKIRAQGPFTGPIPAGAFGANCACLFLWLGAQKRSSLLAYAGFGAALVMVVTSASSTGLMTFAAVVLALVLWPVRKYMRAVRWGLVLFLAVLQIFMKAPFWMVINHIDLVGGNSSYHRAMLIDGFIWHFADWWLIGVESTAGWGWDMWDQANQFVAEGENGGLATIVCFTILIVRAFRQTGLARKLAEGNLRMEWACWALGGALFSQVVSFFGISFSDQSVHGWYALLAIIPAATATIFKPGSTDAAADATAVAPREPLSVAEAWLELNPHRRMIKN
jgi:hypothetical protein